MSIHHIKYTAMIALLAFISGACEDSVEVRMGPLSSVVLEAPSFSCWEEADQTISALEGDKPRLCLWLENPPCVLELRPQPNCEAPCVVEDVALVGCEEGAGEEPIFELEEGQEVMAMLTVTQDECIYSAEGPPRLPCEGSVFSSSSGQCLLGSSVQVSSSTTSITVRTFSPSMSALFDEEIFVSENAFDFERCPVVTATRAMGEMCVHLSGEGEGALLVQPDVFSSGSCAKSGAGEVECPTIETLEGRELQFQVQPDVCSVVGNWSESGCVGDGCSVSVSPGQECTTAPVTVQLHPTETEVQLEVEGGGQVRIEPLASECSEPTGCGAICRSGQPCRVSVPCGEELRMVATAARGFEFGGWLLEDCDSNVARTCVLTPGPTRIEGRARFRRGQSTLAVNPDGLCQNTRILGPNGLSCGYNRTGICSVMREQLSNTQLSLEVESNAEARLLDWGFNCQALEGCMETATMASFVMPVFDQTIMPSLSFPIRIEAQGLGGFEVNDTPCEAPCMRFVPCAESATVRPVGVGLSGECQTQWIAWNSIEGADPGCNSEICELPGDVAGARRLEATFGVSVDVTSDGGALSLREGSLSPISCTGTKCEAGIALGTNLDVILGDRELWCVSNSCPEVDFSMGRCSFASLSDCVDIDMKIGRRLDSEVSDGCVLTSSMIEEDLGFKCRPDNEPLSSTNMSALYPPRTVDLEVAPTGDFVITDLSCTPSFSGCVVPAPSDMGPTWMSHSLKVPANELSYKIDVDCEEVFDLSVSVMGGVEVTITEPKPVGYPALSDCTGPDCSPGRYLNGTRVTLEAHGDAFMGWKVTDADGDVRNCLAATPPSERRCVVMMTEDFNVEVFFE